MTKMIAAAASIFGCVLTLNSLAASPRTEIHISKAQRARFSDMSQTLQMASITPIINDKDEVICMSIGEIKDKIISDALKAQVGDCFSSVTVFKKTPSGKITNENISILSVTDTLMLYQSLLGASRVDVDIRRRKQTLPISYLID